MVTGDRISYVGWKESYIVPKGAVIFDLGGRTVLPGIIDAHVHGTEAEDPGDPGAESVRRTFLLDGVTSTCNASNALSTMDSFGSEFSSTGIPLGRAFNSGPPISGPLNDPKYSYKLDYPVRTQDEAQAAVDDLISRGANYIRVNATMVTDPDNPNAHSDLLDDGLLYYVMNYATANGKMARAHANSPYTLVRAIAAGARVIEGTPAFPDVTSRLTDPSSPDAEFARELIDLMVNSGVILVPTIEKLNNHQPWMLASGSGYEAVVSYFVEHGGVVALGTDYPLAGAMGMPMNELLSLQRAGLSPEQIIQAATSNASVACGQGNSIGSLAPGKLADFIALDGNPMDSLSAFDHVAYVVLGGQIVAAP